MNESADFFGGLSYPESIVLSYQKSMAKMARENEALRADLKAVAVALHQLRAAEKEGNFHPWIVAQNAAEEALARPGVKEVLKDDTL